MTIKHENGSNTTEILISSFSIDSWVHSTCVFPQMVLITWTIITRPIEHLRIPFCIPQIVSLYNPPIQPWLCVGSNLFVPKCSLVTFHHIIIIIPEHKVIPCFSWYPPSRLSITIPIAHITLENRSYSPFNIWVLSFKLSLNFVRSLLTDRRLPIFKIFWCWSSCNRHLNCHGLNVLFIRFPCTNCTGNIIWHLIDCLNIMFLVHNIVML
jgi:hypothetical protein